MMPSIFRLILFPLITFRPTYFVGMVLVRLSRKLKNRQKTDRKEFVTISNFMGRISMRVDRNSYMGGSIYWCGFHHINELLFLRSYLTSKMVFIDVGANQGEFALYAASRLQQGKVIAFEPTSYQLSLLRENVRINKFLNVEIAPYGLYDSNTHLEVFTTYEMDRHGGVNEGLSSLYRSEERNMVEEMVELKVFDQKYLNTLSRIDVVKIDVEGAEFFVLKGMRESLIRFRPLLLIEMNNKTFVDAGYSMGDVVLFLTEIGYQPFKLLRGRLKDFDELNMDLFSNVVFIHKLNLKS